ncbi:MAG TPA: glycosyltransferase 61 family protein [Rhizomicrobium sp.]|jgi:hypothetical protein|nr:glycosyltransferase 61 family protein [Rhizomicrobium sp.]
MSNDIQFRYFDQSTKRRQTIVSSHFVQHSPPPIADIKSGIVWIDSVPKGKRSIAHGAYFADGSVIPESLPVRHTRSDRAIPQLPSGSSEKLLNRLHAACYLGDIRDHYGQYGHFVLETLSRAWNWCTTANGSVPVILGRRLPKFAHDFYALIPGLVERLVLMDESTRCDNLTVPGPAFVLDKAIHYQFKELCEQIATRSGAKKSRTSQQPLYLSRAGLDPASHRTIIGEDRLERLLQNEGFVVARPEKLSIEDQIALFNRHTTVVAPYGSACHTRLFSLIPNTVFVLTSDFINRNHILCDLACLGDTCYANIMVEQKLIRNGLKMRRFALPMLLDDEKTMSLLKDFNLIRPRASFDSPPPAPDAYQQTWLLAVARLAARERNDELPAETTRSATEVL